MTKYLISFPGEAMVFPAEDFQAVADDAHAVVEAAKQAGVYVFGGGVNEDVEPVRVAADGTVTPGGYPDRTVPNGGYLVLEVPTRKEAEEWAAKVAKACRCAQELREFQYDPAG